MLVAARDECGYCRVFNEAVISDVVLGNGIWMSNPGSILRDIDAEPFCQYIPPGEKRIIESLSVTYRPEPNTAVEELVEAALTFRSSYTAGVLTGAIPSISVEMLFSALARVEAEKKGGN